MSKIVSIVPVILSIVIAMILYKYGILEIKLISPTSDPMEILDLVNKNFKQLYRENVLYRASGVILSDLVSDDVNQQDLFDFSKKQEQVSSVLSVVDKIDEKYGKKTIFLGSSYFRFDDQTTLSRQPVFFGKQKKLKVPFLGEVN